jgi:hypothetical protein
VGADWCNVQRMASQAEQVSTTGLVDTSSDQVRGVRFEGGRMVLIPPPRTGEILAKGSFGCCRHRSCAKFGLHHRRSSG